MISIAKNKAIEVMYCVFSTSYNPPTVAHKDATFLWYSLFQMS
ncbi:MAG: hypothetical protein ACLR43_08210 [Faecalibacillus faecis]